MASGRSPGEFDDFDDFSSFTEVQGDSFTSTEVQHDADCWGSSKDDVQLGGTLSEPWFIFDFDAAGPLVCSELQATGAGGEPLDAAMDSHGNRSEANLIATPQPVDHIDEAPADEEACSDPAADAAVGGRRGVERSGEGTEGANSRDPVQTEPHIQTFCEMFNRDYGLAPEGVAGMAYVLRDDVISAMFYLLASGQSIEMFSDEGLAAQQRFFLVNTGGDLCLKPADSQAVRQSHCKRPLQRQLVSGQAPFWRTSCPR